MPAGGDGGFVVGLDDGRLGVTTILDGDVAGRGKATGEVGEVGVIVETIILGALLWTCLTGGTATEDGAAGSVGVGTVFTMATGGDTPSDKVTDRI